MAAYRSLKTLAILALALAFCVQGTLGTIACQNLNKDSCAFAVSSSGKRCVLEKRVKRSGEEAYTCSTSEIEADKLKDWIETDNCIEACGLERDVLGISSDSLLEPRFTQKLCSPQCYGICPNIVDLYFSLAAGEGAYLPKLCEAVQGANSRREMTEIKSSGFVAPGPESGVALPMNLKTLAILALALAFCVQGTLGYNYNEYMMNVTSCRNHSMRELNKDSCAFAVSSSGKRCVLEKRVKRSGEEAYTCSTSEIEADKLKDWIETDKCIEACGLERDVLGISSDSLLEPRFTQKLCSLQCYGSCPNIVDLYFSLAAGEGVYLPKLCEAEQGANSRREMTEIKSSAFVAPGPVSGVALPMVAPAMPPY
ncbi:hypothetical protein RJ639_004836 [Escallonia herrerae]|uniref:PAR1 protein n=1 Tax=Escallonia herrerae TaxID=1293975 RepID=A0AA88W0I5_9ASTE|nr:hypothetical protein RJ639_004836 [Escallonia herrerae]